jgi:hypothetical protein
MFENRRKIAFFLIPHIRAESEILKNPRLRELPFAVRSSYSDKSVILDFYRLGSSVYRGMPVKLLRPNILCVALSPGWVEEIEEEILLYLSGWTPLAEARELGQYYLDLSGTEKLFGSSGAICLKILEYLRERYSFHCQASLGSNKLSSYLAAQYSLSRRSPQQLVSLLGKNELEFIRGLSIFLLPDIPHSVKRELYASYNIGTIGDLGRFSFPELVSLLGRYAPVSSQLRIPRQTSLLQYARRLFEYSRNKAPDRIILRHKEKKIQGEVVFSVFSQEKANHNIFIRGKFFSLLAELCFSLREKKLFPSAFKLSVYYSDEYCFHKEAKLKLNDDSNLEKELMAHLFPHLKKALERRLALSRLRLVFSARIDFHARQGDLFRNTEKSFCLSRAYDCIKRKYGSDSIKYACQLDIDVC